MDINGKDGDGLLNLIMLEGYTIAKGGVHAQHPAYNKALIDFFNERWKESLKIGNEDEAIELLGDEILKVQQGIQNLLLERSVIGSYDDAGNWVRTKVDDLITIDDLKSML